MNASRRAVYTAVFGSYESNLPVPPPSAVDYICFTDNPEFTSDRWRVEVVEPAFDADPVRSARHLKILGHPVLDDYAETLWVDNRIELLGDPEDMLERWLRNADLSMPWHSYRANVLDEFVAVIDGGFDDPARVQEQLLHYLLHAPEALQEKPFWTGVIARRATAEVTNAMHMWHDHVLRYSRRDQLSVNLVMRRAGIAVETQPIDAFQSGQHRWRTFEEAGRRTSDETRRAAVAAFLPPAVTLRELERRSEASAVLAQTLQESAVGLAHELDQAENGRQVLEREIAEVRSALQALQDARAAEAAESQLEIEALRQQVHALSSATADLVAQREALLGSRSWRVTRPLRAVSTMLRRRKVDS